MSFTYTQDYLNRTYLLGLDRVTVSQVLISSRFVLAVANINLVPAFAEVGLEPFNFILESQCLSYYFFTRAFSVTLCIPEQTS